MIRVTVWSHKGQNLHTKTEGVGNGKLVVYAHYNYCKNGNSPH